MKLSRRRLLTASPSFLLAQLTQFGQPVPDPPPLTLTEASAEIRKGQVERDIILWVISVMDWRVKKIEAQMLDTTWWRNWQGRRRPT